MTELPSCETCRFLLVPAAEKPCRLCRLLPSGEWTEWQPRDDTYTHPVVGKVHVHPTPGVAGDFETHPAGTMRRIAQLEQEVAACERRLADMAREMQKFMDEAQQRR